MPIQPNQQIKIHYMVTTKIITEVQALALMKKDTPVIVTMPHQHTLDQWEDKVNKMIIRWKISRIIVTVIQMITKMTNQVDLIHIINSN